MRYLFGPFELVLGRRELRCGPERVPIARLPLDLLAHLISNRDRVVTKDELAFVVWQQPVVSDEAITRAVADARRAVGDDGRTQSWISTTHGRGYAFVGVVTEIGAERPPDESLEHAQSSGATWAVEQVRRAAEALGRQLRSLSDEKRRALRLMAALGHTFDHEALQRVVRDARTEAERRHLLEVVREAVRWGLLQTVDGAQRYAFAHEAVRRLVLDEDGPPE